MNREHIKRILSSTKVKKYMLAGELSKAVEAAAKALTEHRPEGYELVAHLIENRKRRDGVFLPTPIKAGSTLEKAMIEYVEDLNKVYDRMADEYSTELGDELPLTREEVYLYAIDSGVKIIRRGNTWNVNNLQASATWEEVNFRLSELYYSVADPTPSLTNHLIKEIRSRMLYTKDIRSDVGQKARLVRFIGLLADAFKLDRQDLDKMRALLGLAVAVAARSFLSIKGEFTPENEHMRIGFICGTNFQESNTAVDRIRDAVLEHKRGKEPKKPTTYTSDALGL